MTTPQYDVAGTYYFKDSFVEEKVKKSSSEFAADLIEGNFTVGYGHLTTFPYDSKNIDSFDWTFSSRKLSNTFLLYIYGLRHVYILSEAFLRSNNQKYFELAWDFIVSFSRFQNSKENSPAMVYNDHAVAERLENLVYFGYVAQQKKEQIPDEALLKQLIFNCLGTLADPKVYQTNNNHGIIADKAMIIGATCLNDDRSSVFYDLAINRLKAQIDFAFRKDGVHVENSIDYHVTVTDLIFSIVQILKQTNHLYASELEKVLQNSIAYLSYALKPDLQRPLFGDSEGIKNKVLPLCPYHNSILDYIVTKGQKGTRPPQTLKSFRDTGYVFIREHFNAENFEQSTWLSLKAGFLSRIHKHRDDLSLCFYSKGYDIFIDPGMYNFMIGNQYKDYFESVPAHTTIGVMDESYSIARSNGENSRILVAESREGYDYVCASSRVYEGCTIYRHLYYLREQNLLVIRDEAFSSTTRTFTQYFHLGPDIVISELNQNRTVLQIGGSGMFAIIRQLSDGDNPTILEGTDTIPMSILSTGFSEFKETQTLQYNHRGHRAEFVTVVEMKNFLEAKDSSHDIVKLENHELVIDKTRIVLEKTEPVHFIKADVEISELSLRITNSRQADIYSEYSAYIFDSRTKQAISKTPYTAGDFIDIELPFYGDFDIVYYTNNGIGDLTKGVLATLRLTHGGKIKVEQLYKNLHKPMIGKLLITKQTDNTYNFVVPIKYDFSYQVRWWIYRYGVSIKTTTVFENNEFTYHFSRPGEYVILFSINDTYFGESHFEQSPLLEID